MNPLTDFHTGLLKVCDSKIVDSELFTGNSVCAHAQYCVWFKIVGFIIWYFIKVPCGIRLKNDLHFLANLASLSMNYSLLSWMLL